MPELNFVLPHWAYWCGLALFPLLALIIHHKTRPAESPPGVSLSLGYLLLLTGGFIGVHRLYLKSAWALAFIAVFVGILAVNIEVRETRDALSGANNAVNLAEFRLQRADKARSKGRRGAEEKLERAKERLTAVQSEQLGARERSERWKAVSRGLGGLMVVILLIDLLLLPRLVRRCRSREQPQVQPGFQCPAVEAERDDDREPFLFNRIVSKVNGLAGEFVAYWSVIAVFVYYYEVIARYVLNSPTNWAHEGMFLMFGMQYLLAGGYVLREGAHVRVDVVYNHLPKRGKAIVDVLTSIFFFIFMATLLLTGWTFFMDSYSVNEVSFTEWAIQYWPIKFALPLGAALLLLQGLAQLAKDIAVAISPASAELDTEVRPEG